MIRMVGDKMYNLGEHFHNKDISSLVARDDCVFKGLNYRITILSERLVRLEYNDKGEFNDLETINAKNRRFSMPNFTKKENE